MAERLRIVIMHMAAAAEHRVKGEVHMDPVVDVLPGHLEKVAMVVLLVSRGAAAAAAAGITAAAAVLVRQITVVDTVLPVVVVPDM